MVLPLESAAVAVNCRVAPTVMLAEVGEMLMDATVDVPPPLPPPPPFPPPEDEPPPQALTISMNANRMDPAATFQSGACFDVVTRMA
jgi:hypothetical protein